MRTALVLVALVGTHLLSSAAGERLPLVQPTDSGLVLAKLVRQRDLSATFSGESRVSGTFMGFWPGGATNRKHNEPDYLFIPDKQTSNRLPHFALREAPYAHDYKVRWVTVTNGQAALKQAAGSDRVAKLLQRRVNHVRITGFFVIGEFVVGVECDAPWARAKLFTAELPDQVAVKHAFPPETC
jgi:hypothetical protein